MFRKARLSHAAATILVFFGLFLCARAGLGAESFHSADPYAKIASYVFQNVEKRYVEPSRAVPKNLLKGAFKALEGQYPQVLINLDEGAKEATVRVDDAEKRFDLTAASRFAGAGEVLNGVLGFVSARVLEDSEDVEKQDVYYVGLNGALSALDPHSNAFSPEQLKEFMIGTRGSFGGIGFVFGIREGDMTIITPIDGTPASRAGVRTGDKILYIDGEPTINMPVDIAANKMRGDPGTQVTLTIVRESWSEPKPFTFTREVIHVDSVESYVLNGDEGAPVLYAKVKNFQKDTTDELRKAVREAESRNKNLAGVILDLRNDPGGLLDEAVKLSDGFMDRGTIVHTRGPEEEDRKVASGDTPISKKPLIVLINQGSASASEIVAGALKSYRGLLIGQKTFGKGSVQKIFPLPDGGAVKLTIAQYLTPGDISIQSIGVQPDVVTYPVQTVKGQVRLGPPPAHVAESELENAFKDWGNASEKPWREIQYLGTDVTTEDEKPFVELSRPEKIARLRGEFEVRLARRILERAEPGDPSRSRERLFKVAEPVLEEVRREEDAKITRSLGEKGLEWADGRSDGKPKLSVRFSKEPRLEGGTTADFTVAVKNEGSHPVYRVWGRTESANPLLKNLDLPFGRIDPGKEKFWTVKVEVPKAASDRWDAVTLALKSGWNQEVGSGQGGVRQVGGPLPRLAYNYEIREDNPGGDKARPNNGLIEEGDRLELNLTIRNRGTVAVTPVEVNIRGDEGEQLHLEAARKKLESVGPGEKKEAPLAFRLVKAEKKRKANVLVSISNKDYGLLMTDAVRLPLGKRLEAKELRDSRVPPELEFSKAPPLRTAANRVSVDLKALDDEGIKDVYAYLGEKKLQYVRNRGRTGLLATHLEVPLEPGSNRLTLFARDAKNILTSRTFFIFRQEASEEQRVGMQ